MKSKNFAFFTTCLQDSDSLVEVFGIDCTDFGSLGMAHLFIYLFKHLVNMQIFHEHRQS